MSKQWRRIVLIALTLSVSASLWLTEPMSDAAAATSIDGAARLSLPAPTGRHRVGTTSLHLVDESRSDRLAPSARDRELMVQLWYPASRTAGQPRATYLPAGVSSLYAAFINAGAGTSHPADLLSFATNSRQDAPAAAGARRPVVLFSPGFGLNAALSAGLHEELASHGYVVAGIDHTFDAGAVQFPDGRLEPQRRDLAVDDVLREVRVEDTRFVLDALTVLAGGGNPDAGGRRLPAGLGTILDLERVAAFGYSLGSPTVISAIDQDQRFDTGAALDGNPLGAVSLSRPFLLMGNQTHRRADDPDWAAFYDQLRGPRLHVVIDGAEHSDLSDIAVFKDTIEVGAIFETGPIDGDRALAIERAYLTAWLDEALLGRPSALLRGESPRFPEVDLQP